MAKKESKNNNENEIKEEQIIPIIDIKLFSSLLILTRANISPDE